MLASRSAQLASVLPREISVQGATGNTHTFHLCKKKFFLMCP